MIIYKKMEVKYHSNRRISNQLESASAQWSKSIGVFAWFYLARHWQAQFIIELFVEHQQFVDYCPWEVELKLKLNFGLLGGEKDNQKCESRKKIESFCHGGKSYYWIKLWSSWYSSEERLSPNRKVRLFIIQGGAKVVGQCTVVGGADKTH